MRTGFTISCHHHLKAMSPPTLGLPSCKTNACVLRMALRAHMPVATNAFGVLTDHSGRLILSADSFCLAAEETLRRGYVTIPHPMWARNASHKGAASPSCGVLTQKSTCCSCLMLMLPDTTCWPLSPCRALLHALHV